MTKTPLQALNPTLAWVRPNVDNCHLCQKWSESRKNKFHIQFISFKVWGAVKSLDWPVFENVDTCHLSVQVGLVTARRLEMTPCHVQSF